jgi:lipoprotein-releasing system ATP-binding protein
MGQDTKTILEVIDLCKSYGDKKKTHILSNINLKINAKTSTAIMGASGEGKTTLLHILGSLEQKDKGEIFLSTQPLSTYTTTSLRGEVFGFIFQSCNLIEDLSTFENVILPARIARKDITKNSDSYNRAKQLLSEVNLTKKENSIAKTLSGGEKQRVAIARALINDPKIILADEPTGNLDHTSSQAIHQLLLQCVKKYDKTLIVVTHDKELSNLCDKTLLLQNGDISQIS